MNIILLTVLLTILGVCLVGGLTWVGITSYKLMKHKKVAEETLNDLSLRIDKLQNELIDEIYHSEKRSIDAMNNEINVRSSICDRLDGKIDSRIDKLTEKVNTLASKVE